MRSSFRPALLRGPVSLARKIFGCVCKYPNRKRRVLTNKSKTSILQHCRSVATDNRKPALLSNIGHFSRNILLAMCILLERLNGSTQSSEGAQSTPLNFQLPAQRVLVKVTTE